MSERRSDRDFVRTFFTSPAAVRGAEDSAKLLRGAVQFRGMRAPDIWVPDNEDATAASMRDEGVANIVDVVSEHGADFPGEIHPRIVWHRDRPADRYRGFEQMLAIADPDEGAGDHIDGFTIPEIGGIDDWKRADEQLALVEAAHGFEAGRLAMSVVVESAVAELALDDLRDEISRPTNTLERLFVIADGEVDYTKDMRATTPTGALPEWPELRHNTARAASAVDRIAVDGAYDDIRDLSGYRERMRENRAKGLLGIWALTPEQVAAANEAALPPTDGRWFLELDGDSHPLESTDDRALYRGQSVEIEALADDRYRVRLGRREDVLTDAALRETVDDAATYVPGLDDLVESMAEFEAARDAGEGAVSMTRATVVVVDGVEVDVERDRMWDEATYQAARTPVSLLRDVYEHRPDQRDALRERYGRETLEAALDRSV